jgi:hypothetical protein
LEKCNEYNNNCGWSWEEFEVDGLVGENEFDETLAFDNDTDINNSNTTREPS